jgi:NADH-quinone oxidoreductase subunit N
MLGGVVVGTKLGVNATVLYLGVYLLMNITAFAVIIAVQRSGNAGDDISGLSGLGSRQPWLAWPMTIAMLSLAGIPGTVGFIGKFQLIRALVDGDYTWLGIVLVIGSMISLGYYLRVVATMWMTGTTATAPVSVATAGYAPIAGGSQEADDAPDEAHDAPAESPTPAGPAAPASGGPPPAAPASGEPPPGARTPAQAIPQPDITLVAMVFAAASVFFGIVPGPLFHLVAHAGNALAGLVP